MESVPLHESEKVSECFFNSPSKRRYPTVWMILTMLRPIPQSPSSLPANSHNRPKKKRLFQKEKGFTLIEMKVLIVIIGILANIAMGIHIHVRKTDELRTLTSAVNDLIKSYKSQKAP